MGDVGPHCLVARSISRPVPDRLPAARVLAVFERACDLVTEAGDVIALVTPDVGDGPLNIVVEGQPGCFAGVETGTIATVDNGTLWVGNSLSVSLKHAAIWEPRPDWERFRAQYRAMVRQLPHVRARARQIAPTGSLLTLLESEEEHLSGKDKALVRAARRGVAHLKAGWDGQPDRLSAGASRLAGLGSGLTPAGDDFLAGAMLRAWLEHPDPPTFCRIVVGTAAPRTHVLAAAFLRAAAGGECSAAWHALLAALDEGNDAAVERAVRDVLAHGATSGADTLAGFLFRK